MCPLVTGVLEERAINRAVSRLTALEVAKEDIFLTSHEVTSPEHGAKSGEGHLPHKQHSHSSLSVGLILGGTVGLLLGLGTGVLGYTIAVVLRALDLHVELSDLVVNPGWSTAIGILIGLVSGGLFGCFVEFIMARIASRASRPDHETRFTVRCDESRLSHVCAALHRVPARHVEVLFGAES